MTAIPTGAKMLQHRSTLSVRELDHLDYISKVRHWMRDDAWSPGGVSLRFDNPRYAIGDFLIADGHITQSKPLIGRPCFGIATALLRYEHATRYAKGRGIVPTGRCHSCKAKDACRWVVTNRLKSRPALNGAWIEWLQESGSDTFNRPNYKKSHAYRCWKALCRELQRHPFKSANDRLVVEAYEERDRIERAKDADRKARDRRRARRSGELDQRDIELLGAARNLRGKILIDAKQDEKPPKQIAKVPGTSLIEMLDVWLAREILRAQGVRPTLGKIADWIIDNNRRNKSQTLGALQTRVSRDLKRIERLERVPFRNGFLLPTLDKRIEFRSDIDGDKGATLTP